MSKPGDITNKVILIAEDDVVNALYAEQVCKKLGHEPVCVGTGKDVLEILHNRPIDMILMDISMPVLSGIEALRMIRNSDGAHSELPVIAVTAHASYKKLENIRKEDFDGVLIKPYTYDDLKELIERTLL